MNNTPQAPVVSVWLITYNHSPFIAQAIESVLMQNTTFPFELVIGDDGSTDGTWDIVKQYAQKFPSIIKARSNKPNIGMIPNMVKTLEECQGQYIAMLEGDDYWSHSGKLQLQVDYLDTHPECSLCATAFERLKDGVLLPDVPKQSHIGFDQMLVANTLGTASVLFPKHFITPQTFKYLDQYSIGDWPLWCWLLQHGDGVVLPETTAVYRINESGAWSQHNFYAQVKLSITVKIKLINYWSVANHEKWLWHDYRVVFLRDEPSSILRKDLYTLMPPSRNRSLLIVCSYLSMPLFRSVLRKITRQHLKKLQY